MHQVIRGEPVQGGLILFDSKKAAKIKLDGKLVSLNQENGFVVGFHRDDPLQDHNRNLPRWFAIFNET